jgi:hypothetical protein
MFDAMSTMYFAYSTYIRKVNRVVLIRLCGRTRPPRYKLILFTFRKDALTGSMRQSLCSFGCLLYQSAQRIREDKEGNILYCQFQDFVYVVDVLILLLKVPH